MRPQLYSELSQPDYLSGEDLPFKILAEKKPKENFHKERTSRGKSYGENSIAKRKNVLVQTSKEGALDMDYEISYVTEIDRESLAELRIAAMKESLESIGRFDPDTARNRFLNSFNKDDTRKVLIDGSLVGFYVIHKKIDYIHLDHLYFFPKYQGLGFGTKILALIKRQALEAGLPIRLGALRGSRSNDFYKKHGFIYTHEEEWDIYYEFTQG